MSDGIDYPDEWTAPPFNFVRLGSIEPTAPAYIVRPFLEQDALAALYSPPGMCKTFFAIDVAGSVATGTPFHGHEVERAPVIYIAGEGRNGIARRRRAWEIARGIDLADAPLFLSERPAELSDPANVHAIINAVDEIAQQHGSPGLIVVDTLARNFGPGDENATRDVSRLIQHLDALRRQHRATVLLVHHTGHADKSRARGAMALKGALDAEYRMDRDDAGVIRLVATKMKDAAEPEPLAFQLRTVELGFEDDDGEPVTSAVLHAVEYEAPSAGPTGRDLNALRVLVTMQDSGTPKLAEWRGECIAQGIIAGRNADAQTKAMQRTVNSLRDHRLIQQGMGRGIWVPTEQGRERGQDERTRDTP